jgi:hypothetical protein
MPLWWRDPPQGLDKTTMPDDVALWVPEKKPGQFVPAPDLNLVAWYDASQLTFANGATVSLWPDLSGSGNDLTPVVGTPTCTAPGQNGLRIVTFPGSAAFQGPPYLSNLGFNTPLTFVALVRASSIPTTSIIIVNRVSTETTINLLLCPISTAILACEILDPSGPVMLFNKTGIFPLSTWFVLTQTYDGKGVASSFAFYLMQTQLTPLTNSGSTKITDINLKSTSNTFIGAQGNGASSFHGDMAEILLYKTVLNDTQRYQVIAYLRKKWNV